MLLRCKFTYHLIFFFSPEYFHAESYLNLGSRLPDNLYYSLTRPSIIDQLTFKEKTLKTGETVITPYIDMQPITTIPPSPMSGAGLIYKNETYEFLALKLFTHDITPFLKEEDDKIFYH